MQFLFQDVLNEITRLKEEANRFISILSQEDDPDKSDELLSPGKRQSLTREVESLQVNFLYFSVKSKHLLQNVYVYILCINIANLPHKFKKMCIKSNTNTYTL